MDFNALKRDSAAIAAGVWVSDIPEMGDLRLKVRGLSSPVATALRQRKERAAPKTDRDRAGRLKPEASVRVTAEVLLEVVLIDWDGLTDNGKPVPYSREVAEKLLTDPDFLPFADAVAWAATVVDRGEAEKAEDAAGN